MGLSTLDLVHFVERFPGRNEKIFAHDTFIGAGGPATNAAVTYSFLGGNAHLLSSVGEHSIGLPIVQELVEYGVSHTEAQPSRTTAPLISSVIVSTDNGDRSIVSSPVQISPAQGDLVKGLLRELSPALVLVDGHEIELALNAARLAKQRRIPVVFDGGRWKDDFETLLEHVDHALVSEAFRCPGGGAPARVITYLHEKGAQYAAITRGHSSIIHSSGKGLEETDVRKATAVDTLAAGDIFHGAYCFGYWGLSLSFPQALEYAAQVASYSCRHYGPRSWMRSWPQ